LSEFVFCVIAGNVLLLVFIALMAFSALTLVVEHLVCKKFSDEVLTWLSVVSKVQMICISSS